MFHLQTIHLYMSKYIYTVHFENNANQTEIDWIHARSYLSRSSVNKNDASLTEIEFMQRILVNAWY